MMVNTGPDYEELRDILRKAEYAYQEDLVGQDDGTAHGSMLNGFLDVDEGGNGSASDSE